MTVKHTETPPTLKVHNADVTGDETEEDWDSETRQPIKAKVHQRGLRRPERRQWWR